MLEPLRTSVASACEVPCAKVNLSSPSAAPFSRTPEMSRKPSVPDTAIVIALPSAVIGAATSAEPA